MILYVHNLNKDKSFNSIVKLLFRGEKKILLLTLFSLVVCSVPLGPKGGSFSLPEQERQTGSDEDSASWGHHWEMCDPVTGSFFFPCAGRRKILIVPSSVGLYWTFFLVSFLDTAYIFILVIVPWPFTFCSKAGFTWVMRHCTPAVTYELQLWFLSEHLYIRLFCARALFCTLSYSGKLDSLIHAE